MPLLTAAECGAIDRATIAAGTPGATLMERAGRGVADSVERRFGAALARRVLVLCGPGNNGGDGFVAARHLRERGALVRVGCTVAPATLAGDARAAAEAWRSAGGEIAALDSAAAIARLGAEHDRWDVVVDALLGTGARGEPRDAIAAACAACSELRAYGAKLVAIDLPFLSRSRRPVSPWATRPLSVRGCRRAIHARTRAPRAACWSSADPQD